MKTKKKVQKTQENKYYMFGVHELESLGYNPVLIA